VAARGFERVHGAKASDSANTVKATGGHGGPPLQYVRWRPWFLWNPNAPHVPYFFL